MFYSSIGPFAVVDDRFNAAPNGRQSRGIAWLASRQPLSYLNPRPGYPILNPVYHPRSPPTCVPRPGNLTPLDLFLAVAVVVVVVVGTTNFAHRKNHSRLCCSYSHSSPFVSNDRLGLFRLPLQGVLAVESTETRETRKWISQKL